MMDETNEVISSTPQSEELRKKNIEFFKEFDIELYNLIMDAPPMTSVLSFVDGEIDNVLVNGVPMYGTSVSDYCRNQLDDFWKNPERIVFGDISRCNVSPISRGMIKKLNKRFFVCNDVPDALVAPVVDSGFCFILGVGLGKALPEMIEKNIARYIVIVEPIFEMFCQSLSVIDWKDIFEKVEKNGAKITFFFNKSPMEVVGNLEVFVRKKGNSFLDGTYFFVHYPSWELQEIYRNLRERLRNYYQTTGFFEDELLMMRNSYQNLCFSDYRFVKRKRYLHQDYPVFVVATGPSLEFDLDYVKKFRDQVILVSSGTTIHLFLNEGLVPDFHAELENVEAVYDLLKPKAEQFDLSSVTLLASTTVDKRVPKLFGDVYFFARGGVSSTTVFCKDIGEIPEVAPYSANAALASIATLGFRNIYLFGVDCGRYEGAKHHASGSVYEEIGIEDGIEESLDFCISVPGNFGGSVSTTVLLDMSRWHITNLVGRLGLRISNCSHGARIDGTTPLASGAIKLTNPANQQSHIKEMLYKQSKLYQNGEYIDRDSLRDNVEKADTLKKELSEMIEESRQDISSFFDFDRAFESFWGNRWENYGSLLIIMGGSFASMIRLGAFMGIRMEDEDIRSHFMAVFYDCFEEQCLWMLDVLKDYFSQMADGVEELELPEDFVFEEVTEQVTGED